MFSGVLAYFPDAIFCVARLSKIGNDKHNPGEPLHWAKEKSSDEPDCIMRHLADHGIIDPDDGVLHEVKLAWRGLGNLQRFIDAHGIEACFDEEIIARIKADREAAQIAKAAPKDQPLVGEGPGPGDYLPNRDD